MMTMTAHDEHAYLEVEVYGAYEEAKMGEFFDLARRMVEKHGHFSELEVHHGKPENAMKIMLSHARQNHLNDLDSIEFLKQLRKYAVVSDDPGLFFRIYFEITGRLGKAQFRMFKSHQREEARAWIENRA